MVQRWGAGRTRELAALAAAAAAVFLLRGVVRELLIQLGAGYVVMALALPLCRRLEKRMPPTPAALLAFAVLGTVLAAALVLVIPPLLRQFTLFAEMLPGLIGEGEQALARLEGWLGEKGVDLIPVRDGLFDQLQSAAGGLLTVAAGTAQRVASSLSRLFLAPLFAFYLLRDRRRITAELMLLAPVRCRARVVRAAREMRRETVGFLRGQLLLAAFVGLLTALGLLLTGSQAWLMLGLLMGVMELVPYIGPLLAGIPAVLLALPGGWGRVAWTLAVLVAVQQLEGAVLSPRVMAGAVRLHPLAVLIAISAGGFAAGPLGMLLALPAVVCVRGALRGWKSA